MSAMRLLQTVPSSCYKPIHHHIQREGLIFEKLLDQSNDHHSDEWIKQGEQHGMFNFCMYYKVSKENQLTCRIETPICAELLVPLLSVLNESELYQTWIPQYRVPKFEVARSDKLRQIGRCGQILLVETEVQWPLGSRQLLLKAVACDDIGSELDLSSGGKILIRLESLCDQADKDELDGIDVPPTKKGYVRMEVQGGFVFEKCPLLDHPMKNSAGGQDDLVLVTFSFSVNPKLRIPQSLINFFVRTAIGHVWGMFLRVAEDVKEGKRPAHSEAIEKKREVLYDWVESRTRVMIG
eukprot:scaffold8496_cov66-Cyclotella_meneghiniana.AAC.19